MQFFGGGGDGGDCWAKATVLAMARRASMTATENNFVEIISSTRFRCWTCRSKRGGEYEGERRLKNE